MEWTKRIDADIKELVGKTLVSVTNDTDEAQLVFVTDDGTTYRMFHDQDCCEGVSIEEIIGDLQDLVGKPILLAEERTQDKEIDYGAAMWTFYEFATNNGNVTIRWYGESNGYYGIGVSFYREKK